MIVPKITIENNDGSIDKCIAPQRWRNSYPGDAIKQEMREWLHDIYPAWEKVSMELVHYNDKGDNCYTVEINMRRWGVC